MKTLLLTLLLSVPVEASAADHPAGLLRWLSAIDLTPTKAQLLEAGVDDDGVVLAKVAADAHLTRYPRARAASLLVLFDRPSARVALARLSADADDLEVRVQAIGALARLEGTAGLTRLEGLLRDPEPELRAASIRALRRLEDPRALGVLLAHREKEPIAYVKALLPAP